MALSVFWHLLSFQGKRVKGKIRPVQLQLCDNPTSTWARVAAPKQAGIFWPAGRLPPPPPTDPSASDAPHQWRMDNLPHEASSICTGGTQHNSPTNQLLTKGDKSALCLCPAFLFTCISCVGLNTLWCFIHRSSCKHSCTKMYDTH